jgi:hypothetical protein
MPTDPSTQRTLEAIASRLNDAGLDEFDPSRVQKIVDEVRGTPRLSVDDGGGVHDPSGARVGAIRRSPSGEWIVERQNPEAERADAPVPEAAPEGPLKRFTDKIRMRL